MNRPVSKFLCALICLALPLSTTHVLAQEVDPIWSELEAKEKVAKEAREAQLAALVWSEEACGVRAAVEIIGLSGENITVSVHIQNNSDETIFVPVTEDVSAGVLTPEGRKGLPRQDPGTPQTLEEYIRESVGPRTSVKVEPGKTFEYSADAPAWILAKHKEFYLTVPIWTESSKAPCPVYSRNIKSSEVKP